MARVSRDVVLGKKQYKGLFMSSTDINILLKFSSQTLKRNVLPSI